MKPLIPLLSLLHLVSPCTLTPQPFSDLIPLLSPSALVIGPSDSHFVGFTERYLRSNSPDYSVIVVVATENDVSAAVGFANKYDVPFAAKVTGHGPWRGLAEMKGGINIWLRNLSSIEISEDGNYATVGGGVLVAELVERLWAAGKQTATGLCQCVGVSGSGLGGGLGPLMGEYGLGLDQFVSARVVLANGTAVTVSEESNPDLFWGLRGAGHNFGIVTEVKIRVYDTKDKENWVLGVLVFSGDQVEGVFEELNNKIPDQPSHFSYDVLMIRDPTADPDNAIVLLRLFSWGFSLDEFTSYIAPFQDLSPVISSTTETDYPGLIAELGYGLDSDSCQPGHYGGVFGIGVTKYSLADMRNFYALFNQATASLPEFAFSYVFIEGYGYQAVRNIPSENTAYAHRHLRAYSTVVLLYDAPGPDRKLDQLVDEWGEKMRRALLEGQEAQESYVNYSGEQESLEAMYGYDEWRLKNLRKLKKVYDPRNRFGYYAPIR
ncbi:hypothetical protein OQA88_4302 [Cercophora sp. LCS_1]